MTYAVRVQYLDTDQGGVVHHAAYLRWLEAARVELLRERGIDYRRFELEVGVWRGDAAMIARRVVDDAECVSEADADDE